MKRTKTGKKIKCFGDECLPWLSENERQMLLNFDDGDHVILTNKNSRGLIEGLYQSIDIIKQVQANAEKQRENQFDNVLICYKSF